LIGIHTPQARRATFNSIDQILFETSLFIAPALGAALLAATSATAVIAVDCLTFATAALITLTLPPSRPGGIATTTLGSGASAGFRFVWRHRPLRIGAAGFAVSGGVVTLLQAILVVAAADRFGGADRIGYCYSAVGIGGVLGGLLALRLRARVVSRLDIYTTALCEVTPLTLLALTPALAPALVLLFVSGVGGTLNWTFTTTYMQNHAPGEILGRVSAALTTVNFVGMLLGAAVAFLLSTVFGWAGLLLGFSAICIALLTLVALRSYPDGDTTTLLPT
jgi:predicted MFS family arabinose efflux permease